MAKKRSRLMRVDNEFHRKAKKLAKEKGVNATDVTRELIPDLDLIRDPFIGIRLFKKRAD